MGMNNRLMRPRANTSNRYALLRTSLVGYWPLNETAGATENITAADWTKRGNDLASNNTVPSVTGKVNNARQFAAANSEYLSVSDKADVRFGDSNWTVSAWVYPTRATSGYAHVIGKDESGAREFGMRIQIDTTASNSNRMTLFFGYTDGGFLSMEPAANRSYAQYVNQWWHYVVTNNSGAITLYENGSVFTTANRGAGKVFNASTAPLNIGRRSFSGFLEYFDGNIDEVAKWTRALSATEVSQLYNSGAGIDLRQ